MSREQKEVIVDNIINSIMASSHFKDKEFVDMFNALPHSQKKNIIELILKSQLIAIKEGLLMESDIALPKMGTIRIKPVRRELMIYRESLINEKGKQYFRELNEAEQTEINLQMSNKAKELISSKKKSGKSVPFVRIVNKKDK